MLGTTKNHRYIAGLDGLRAFAVLFVTAYHFDFSWAKGGFLGVDIFFVLSGYLITSTILPVQGNELTLNLREFWMGRIRRLFPAAYMMVIVTFLAVVLFNKTLLTTVLGDAVSSIFYMSNWWFIFHKLSYFDSFGSPSPLKNLWSLAIEEQFYIVWPILLTIGLYVFKKRSIFALIVFIAALCSAALMGWMYEPGTDPSRVYYGTDTRSFELLIGCALALVWPMKRLSSKKLPTSLIMILNIVSIVTFSIFIMSVLFVDEYQSFLYQGGMFVVCLNAAILIACVCHPSSFLGHMLSWKPLKWIGTRSYGIYLWHYPIIVLSTPVYEIGTLVYWRICLQVVSTLIIAELSYRFIEMPIRKHGFRFFLREYLYIHRLDLKSLFAAKRTLMLLMSLVILVCMIGITYEKSEALKNSMHSYPTELKISGTGSETKPTDSDEKEEKVKADQKSSNEDNGKKQEQTEKTHEETKKDEKNSSSASKEILAIGDSVMLDIAQSLHHTYPNITIDAKVGRQVSEAAKLAPSYAAFNHPDKIVIIELGTNGYFTNNQIDTLLDCFSQADIYLVNTRVPRSWESKVNNTLNKKAEEKQNIRLIDWHSVAVNHPEYFTSDGVHLVSRGIEALTSLIQSKVHLE